MTAPDDPLRLRAEPPKTGAEFIERVVRAGGMASGIRVPDDFKAGWAVHPFIGRERKGHFWTADKSVAGSTYAVRSACGKKTVATQEVPLLRVGSYPMCSNCDSALLAVMRRTRVGVVQRL